MALKFPVDTTEPGEIPALASIIEKWPDCEGLLKYLCYRYDPKFGPVREATNQSSRDTIAATYAGWPKEGEDLVLVAGVTDAFFEAMNDFEWEILCSREIVLQQTLEQMRAEFDTNEKDPDKISKAFLLKADLDKRVEEIWGRLVVLYDRLSDGNEVVEKMLKENRAVRRERKMDIR
jgi:hypothetical protein